MTDAEKEQFGKDVESHTKDGLPDLSVPFLDPGAKLVNLASWLDFPAPVVTKDDQLASLAVCDAVMTGEPPVLGEQTGEQVTPFTDFRRWQRVGEHMEQNALAFEDAEQSLLEHLWQYRIKHHHVEPQRPKVRPRTCLTRQERDRAL